MYICRNNLIKFSLNDLFTDNYIVLLKFVSYGHFPEPPILGDCIK